MNKKLMNLFQKNKVKNIGEEEEEERRDTTRYSCQWRNTSGEVVARPTAAMQQYGWTIEW